MAADPFSHPWLGSLFGDPEISELIGANANLAHMIAIEAAYSRALGAVGAVDTGLAERAATATESFTVDIAALRNGCDVDGAVVPSLVRQLKGAMSQELHAAVHKGMTSQDVIDTSLILSLKQVTAVYRNRLKQVISALGHLGKRFGENQLTGRTRMQLALMIRVSDRLHSWMDPLPRILDALTETETQLFSLQLGGPVGNRQSLGPKADEISAHMAKALGLSDPKRAWHSNRMALVSFANWLAIVTGHLGKMGQDIALMSQQGIDEVKISGGGTSSAMPHKQNPIKAELLVSLAQYNAAQLMAMHQAMLHEQERSGVAWTLEWLILPGMLQATGRSLTAALVVIESIEALGTNT